MRSRVFIILALTLAAAAGCTALIGIDNDYELTEADGGSQADAACATPPCTPPADGPADTIADGGVTDGAFMGVFDDFEGPVVIGCGAFWTNVASALSIVPGAGVDGSASCRLCPVAGDPYSIESARSFVDASKGETYFFELDYRDPSGNPDDASTKAGYSSIRYDDADGSVAALGAVNVIEPFVWKKAQIGVTLDHDGPLKVKFAVYNTVAGFLCLDIDNVRIVRQ